MMTELATNKKDNSFAEDASSEDISLEGLQQELEECKNHEVFDFIVQKLYAPRKPKTNIQILQQKVLLKYNVESLKESERRMKDKKTWSIIYIPDKPMAMSNQQPTVEVHACLIEPKHAHTIVRRLNHMAPLEDLRHVKRIQKKNVVGGKTELTAILCVAYQNGSELKDVPQEVQELIESYELIPFITKICCIIKRRVGRTVQAMADIISSPNVQH